MRFPFGRPAAVPPENFLLVTFDSWRYDVYEAARTPVLDRFGPAKRAFTHGTYTFPAHQSMFAGFLPHVFEEEPFYNRFVRQLWCIENRRERTPPLVSFPEGTPSIVHGFRKLGYHTVGVAAMAWFGWASPLRAGFRFFDHTGTGADRQLDTVFSQLLRYPGRPFFAFINFGEPHWPYTCPGLAPLTRERMNELGRIRYRTGRGVRQAESAFMQDIWERQVACTEYLDGKVGELLGRLRQLGAEATLVVCGDHGECLGEEGLFGHAFYHPKVMEVPMLVFSTRGAAGAAVAPPAPSRAEREPGAAPARPRRPGAAPRVGPASRRKRGLERSDGER
jgi:hypothetical protein